MKKHHIILLLGIFFVTPTLATHGTRMVGYSAQTVGRGGAGIGFFDSPSLMMTNPAGISFLSSAVIDGSFSLMIPHVHFTNIHNNQAGQTNYFPIAGLGYVNPLKESEWSWGFGFFTQGGMGADFVLNHDLFRDQSGSFLPQEYHSQLAVMQGGPTVAYRFTEDFAAGVSAHLKYSMLEFTMPYSLSPTIMKGVINPATGMTFGDLFAGSPTAGGFGYSEVTAGAAMEDLSAFGFGAKAGLAYRVSDLLSLGLNYTSPSTMTYKKGTASMDMTAQMNDAFGKAVQGYLMQNPGATGQQAQAAVMQQFGQMGIDLTKGAVADYNLEATLGFPQSISLGTSINASKDLRFALDLEWINWKNAFDNMSLTLTNGANPNINRMLGNTGDFSIEFPLLWKDQFALRVGGEYDVSPVATVRAGYAYGSNPVPDETVFPVFPAIVENHIMVGGSYMIAGRLTIHGAYELALTKKQFASQQSMVAREFSGSSSELSESIFHISMTWALD